VVLWELFSWGQTPFPGMSNRDVLQQVPQGYRMSSPEGCPPEVYQIMQLCWRHGLDCVYVMLFTLCIEPSQRPSFSDLFAKLNQLWTTAPRQATQPGSVNKPAKEHKNNDVEMQVYN
jgi:hypothetical protein